MLRRNLPRQLVLPDERSKLRRLRTTLRRRGNLLRRDLHRHQFPPDGRSKLRRLRNRLHCWANMLRRNLPGQLVLPDERSKLRGMRKRLRTRRRMPFRVMQLAAIDDQSLLPGLRMQRRLPSPIRLPVLRRFRSFERVQVGELHDHMGRERLHKQLVVNNHVGNCKCSGRNCTHHLSFRICVRICIAHKGGNISRIAANLHVLLQRL